MRTSINLTYLYGALLADISSAYGFHCLIRKANIKAHQLYIIIMRGSQCAKQVVCEPLITNVAPIPIISADVVGANLFG